MPASSLTRQVSRQLPATNSLVPQSPAPHNHQASVLTSSLVRATPPNAFDAFAYWAGQFSTNHPTFNLGPGVELARQRRAAMLDLIQADPARALSLAAPYAWRQILPAIVTQYFEEQIDGRGAYNVAVGTDFARGSTTTFRNVQLGSRTWQAYVYGRRLGQVSQASIPLHGIALDGHLAVSTDPLRALTVPEAAALDPQTAHPADVICSVSGQAATSRGSPFYAESGGGVLCFCGEDHYKLVNQQWALAESGGSLESSPGSFSPIAVATADNDAWTHGNKTVLYMRLNFPDDLTEPISAADANAVMDGVNTYYTENSYNLTSLTTTVTPLITLPQVKAYYAQDPSLLLADARAAARAAGYDTANYDRDIAAFTPVPGYTFGGLAYVHGKGVWLQSMGVGVTAHELGHNYGLWHANFWNTLTNVSGIGPGTNLEYGNPYDTMGSGGVAEFNVVHKNILDWMKAEAVQSITSNGVYRLYPFDVPAAGRLPGRVYAAALPKDALRSYWLEYRKQYPANPWLVNGLVVYWSPWLHSNGGAQLVDTTPGSVNANDSASREDAAVVIGRTFSDPAAGVHITPLQRGLTGTEPFIDYQIYLGSFTNDEPPVVSVEVDQTNVPVNTLVHFHATATDPDGDAPAYLWTFDDQTFSTNNLPWTAKTFTTPGDHLVRCVVSDMKGGETSANVVVSVGTANGFQITGYVNDPDGVPIAGVLVGNGAHKTSFFTGGYTDSNGRFTLVNAGGVTNLNAYKFGYVFSNSANWSHPLTVTNTLTDIDFTGFPLPQVSIATDTNVVVETDRGVHQFTVTRTGSVSNDLTVQMDLSGTASVGIDYTLAPDLSATGSITIPAGSSQASFIFQARVNPLLQGTAMTTLTLLDDANMDSPAYVLGPLAEATINLINANPAAKDTVDVATTTPVIEENGSDTGQLVFSRSGSTQNNLLVYYTVSGTALAGLNYTPLSGVVLIPAGQNSTTVPLLPLDDFLVDADQTVTVTLTGNSTYNLASSPSAQIIILNSDYTTVSVTPTSPPAAQPATLGTFTVQRDGDLTPALVVHYNVGGTATSGVDYQPLSGSVTIPPGAASTDITLVPMGGVSLGGNQTVTIILTNTPNYDVGVPGTATLSILDQNLPIVSVQATGGDVSEQGAQFGEFTFTRTGTTGDLPVYFTVNGTAISGFNFVPLTSPVIIPDGSSSMVIDVIPFQDYILEDTQTLVLTLQSNPGYNLGTPASATMHIFDDGLSSEPGVSFCFNASAYPENTSPGIAVVLSTNYTQVVTVDYRVIGGTAPHSRYSLPQGTLAFQPGSQVAFIPLNIINDNSNQPPQTVQVALFNPINATLGGIKIHTYIILNDDAARISVTATVPIASEPGPVKGNFRISRVGATNTSELVTFQITGSASAPNDYASLGTSASIPAGAQFVDLPVIPVNNHLLLATQTVFLTLISATNGTVGSPATATVTLIDHYTNNLPDVNVTATNHPYAYTAGGNGQFLFTRTGPATNALKVSFTISGTATGGVNYVTFTNVVTIPAGQTNATVNVEPLDDHQVDGERTVIVTLLEDGTYHSDYPSAATVTVQDDEQTVWLDASDFTAAKPGVDTGQFTFSRIGTTNASVTVWYTIGGTAKNGAEYVWITNSIVIPAGQFFVTLPVQPIQDHLVEGPKTVVLTLLPNPGYFLGLPATGTVTINDDQPMLTIAALTPRVQVDGTTNGVFRLSRTGDPKYDFTAYLVVGGTAVYGLDYSTFATNVYFTCGVTSIDLTFSATNHFAPAGNQSLNASLVTNAAYTILSPSNAVITLASAGPGQFPVVTITNPLNNVAFLVGTNVGLVLQGSVVDDSPSNSVVWSEVSGPSTLQFENTNSLNTTVLFSGAGVYVLELMATNGLLEGSAELTVIVGADQLGLTNSLHWPFDEGTGTNATDTSGNGRTGTFSGNPSWTTNGIFGDALTFAGTNDWVREAPADQFLNGLKAFTVSLWVKPATNYVNRGILATDDANGNPTFSLSTRATAYCGTQTNLVEVVIPTTQGAIYHDSDSSVLTPNQWQNIAVTWTNGEAPKLYFNGQLDQPAAGFVGQSGVLTNCPQWIVGRGAGNSPAAWNGSVDEVQVFPLALERNQIIALAEYPLTNHGPVISAGANVEVQIGIPVTLTGAVSDDGLPNPPGLVVTEWLYLGTNNVEIPDSGSLTNTLVFSIPGDYHFRLTANDGQITTFSDVTVTVLEPTQVSITADISQAADMGPVLGEYTVMRTGDTNELTVYLGFSGTASNGVNYVTITNAITFPAGSNSLVIPLTPTLDYNIKGDQTALATVLTNIAYTVVGGPATITIKDSPYGYWSIANFSLEELTFPKISGAGADFDHDGLVNFVEYAFNQDPRNPGPNPAFQYGFEVNTNDGLAHFTLTYTRLLPPRVVAYGVFVSSDLLTWNTGTNVVQELYATNNGDGLTETVKAQVLAPVSRTNNFFTTIRVWLAQVPTDSP